MYTSSVWKGSVCIRLCVPTFALTIQSTNSVWQACIPFCTLLRSAFFSWNNSLKILNLSLCCKSISKLKTKEHKILYFVSWYRSETQRDKVTCQALETKLGVKLNLWVTVLCLGYVVTKYVCKTGQLSFLRSLRKC